MPAAPPIRHLLWSLTAACMALSAAAAQAREQIRVVGSSTVYPYVTLAAEAFGKEGGFRTPIVESTGTGGGFKLFCGGVGDDFPDINNASRRITDSELALCRAHGVTDIAELAIGYDGIVFANSVRAPHFSLSLRDIFLALARDVPKNGAPAPNRYSSWREVNPALPDVPIRVYGPPPTSGTRDAFAELVMEKACDAMPEFAAAHVDPKERKNACRLLREDGCYIEAGENYNIVIQKLETNPQALGIIGYGYLAENQAKVQGSLVNGIPPAYQQIAGGAYPVARVLYVYVKRQHLRHVAGLAEFIHELTSTAAIGPEGYLTQTGLLPLRENLLRQTQAVAAQLTSTVIQP
ncbi:MAG: substrate-binding domain-containing protein [Alphaproteobacteria bacterium]|nr:substrate-binding domain-containing protein [Alphaproteobacteria bacterium]